MTLLHQAAQKAVEALKQASSGLEYFLQCVSDRKFVVGARDDVRAAITSLTAALQQQEVPREPPESELVCYEAYAALGMFLMELAEGGHPQAEKLLDNLSQARLVHKDVLPFAPSTTQQQEAGSTPADCDVQRVLGYLKTDEAEIRAAKTNVVWADTMARATDLIRLLAAAPSTPESAEKDDAGGGKGNDGR